MPITFCVRKIGPIHVVEPGLTAGGRQMAGRWQAGGSQIKYR